MTPTTRPSDPWQGDRFELTHAGDVLGRVPGWTCRTDADKNFMRAVTDYAGSLGTVIGRPVAFRDVRAALAQSLGGGAWSAARSSRHSAMLKSIGTSGRPYPLRAPARKPYNVTVPKRVRAACNQCSHKPVLAEADCCVSASHAERTGMQQTPSYSPDYA
jgi:hypothetical protein